MNFDPTEGQLRWRDLARDFARSEIAPRIADFILTHEMDAKGIKARPVLALAAAE